MTDTLSSAKSGHGWPTVTCDHEMGKGSVVDNVGINRIAIVKCNAQNSCAKVDVNGYPGDDSNEDEHNYRNGVAYHLRGFNIPRPMWVRNEWIRIT